ncbi:hypothetical protein P2318_28235 [Myxococcaceae bacterium GXIMD 01537]
MRLPISAALLFLVACSRTTEGPTPQVTVATQPRQRALHPARVCNAQGGERGWRIELSGSGFAPMPVDVLTDSPGVGMPAVTLKGPKVFTLPRQSVFFSSGELLLLDVPTRDSTPAEELPPGSYAVEVKNPTGGTGELANALLVVPPPTLTSVTAPEGFNAAAPSPIVITGTGFQPDGSPSLVLRRAGTPDQPLLTYTVVSDTRINGEIPAGTPEGTYDLVITHPDGCAFTLPNALTIVYARLGALSLEPAFGWQNRNTAITLSNRPTGDEKHFAGGSPEVFLLARLKTAPDVEVQLPLRRAAYVVSDDSSTSTVTAVVPNCSGEEALPLTAPECPNGILPGQYGLKVVDTQGAVGTVPADKGFTVLAHEPPAITALAPGAIDTKGINPLTVKGLHFDASAKVQLANGDLRACDLATTRQGATADTELQAVVPTSIAASACKDYSPRTGQTVSASAGISLSEGLLVVRVQNGQDAAFANYSGLVITNPSTKPLAGKLYGTRLSQARSDFPLVTATDDLGQPFLYALGGAAPGANNSTEVLDSVEVAQVTLFGDLAGVKRASGTRTFRTLERAKLPSARRGHAAVVRTLADDTSYLYVLGGRSTDGKAVKTVERAQVLRVADAPALLPPERLTQEGATLPQGTLYYQVSAVLSATHATNPGGETLPSDEYPVKASEALNAVRLTWTCIPGAAKYRVYRTPEANAPSGTELLLDEVPATACAGAPLPRVTYTDDGTHAFAPEQTAPLPPGALGRWVVVGQLEVARTNAAARLVGDSIYVVGGCDTSANGGECGTGGTTVLDSMERATVAGATPDLGAFATLAGVTLTQPRQRHSLAVADNVGAPGSFSSGSNNGDAYLVVVGGDAGTQAPFTTNLFEVVQVKSASGTLASPADFAPATYSINGGLHGGWAEVAANGLFVAGTSGTNATFRGGVLCPTNNNQPAQCTGANSFDNTLPAAALSYQQGGPRYLSGSTLFRAFVYVAGGLPGDSASGAPTDSVESILY